MKKGEEPPRAQSTPANCRKWTATHGSLSAYFVKMTGWLFSCPGRVPELGDHIEEKEPSDREPSREPEVARSLMGVLL